MEEEIFWKRWVLSLEWKWESKVKVKQRKTWKFGFEGHGVKGHDQRPWKFRPVLHLWSISSCSPKFHERKISDSILISYVCLSAIFTVRKQRVCIGPANKWLNFGIHTHLDPDSGLIYADFCWNLCGYALWNTVLRSCIVVRQLDVCQTGVVRWHNAKVKVKVDVDVYSTLSWTHL